MSDPMNDIWDADLLVGRDPDTATRVTADDLRTWQGDAGISHGVLGSLRALCFDVPSGNTEAAEVAAEVGLTAALSLDTRDWRTARQVLAAAPEHSVVRLAPQRQEGAPTHPGTRAIINAALGRGFPIFCEGDLRVWAPALAGQGATVVFLDAHFYHFGDFLALADDEPGFHLSTRLLNGPDSLQIIRDDVGIERLVFGSRAGFHEGRSALQRVTSAPLSDDERAAVTSGNLRRILGGGPR